MKQILTLLLILLIVSTLSICALKPDMHKTVFVYDSAYTIVPDEQVKVEEKTIPIMEKPVEPKVVKVTVETPKTVEVKQTKVQQPVKTQQKQTVKQQTVKQQQQKTQMSQTKTVTTEQKPFSNKTETKIVEKPVVKEVKNVEQSVKPKVLTEQQEEIAWNVWRSNLQNKIMQDVRLPIIPNGIVFKFSFTVDKFGKISNVQAWSTTPAYTPYAIQYIAPVIRSYQGKSILNFPAGTARTITDVKGGWRISENERYSTPQDYNDIEKVRR